MDTENTKVAITITREDVAHALAELLTENEHISDLVHTIPEMMLVLPLITYELWDQLEKNARMGHVANTIVDMFNKEDE